MTLAPLASRASTIFRWTTRVTLGAFALACGPAEEGASVAQITAAIEGGTPDLEHPAVFRVLLRDGGVNGLCTGSLLSPNLVLTARHCISPTVDQVRCGEAPFGEVFAADRLLLANDQQPRLTSTWRSVLEVRIPEGTSDVCGADVALIILQDEVSPSEVTPAVPRLDSPIAEGEIYTAVGYGFNGDEEDPDSLGVRLRLGDLRVACAAGTCAEGVASNEFRGETGVCGGDSGGPAVDADGLVAGVVSRGSDPCETPVYADVFSWSEWLREVGADAAAVSEYPAPQWLTATGAPGNAGAGSSLTGAEACSVVSSERHGRWGLALILAALGALGMRARGGRRADCCVMEPRERVH